MDIPLFTQIRSHAGQKNCLFDDFFIFWVRAIHSLVSGLFGSDRWIPWGAESAAPGPQNAEPRFPSVSGNGSTLKSTEHFACNLSSSYHACA